MTMTWGEPLPDPERLKAEVEAMAHLMRDLVLEFVGVEHVRGIYHKGSGRKRWASPIDYVPEISDVDVHVWLDDDTHADRLRDIDAALRFQERLESGYQQAVPEPIHLPRPQVMILNRLFEYDDYVPSPVSTVDVLHGEPYPTTGAVPAEAWRRIDARNLQKNADEIRDFGLSALDKPGRFAWSAVRSLCYRVSPAGSRVVSVLGVDPEEAWSTPRTGIVRMLEELGQQVLATEMRAYYGAGWDYFLSAWNEPAHARAVVRHGTAVVRLGAQIAASFTSR